MTYQLELAGVQKEYSVKADFDFSRLPIDLQMQLEPIYNQDVIALASHLQPNDIYCGDARDLLPHITLFPFTTATTHSNCRLPSRGCG